MPVITIDWFEGRSPQQKAEVAKRITEAVSEVGATPPDQVWIRFVDFAKSDWAIGGELQDGGGQPPAGRLPD